jgi:hypothetical protein
LRPTAGAAATKPTTTAAANPACIADRPGAAAAVRIVQSGAPGRSTGSGDAPGPAETCRRPAAAPAAAAPGGVYAVPSICPVERTTAAAAGATNH